MTQFSETTARRDALVEKVKTTSAAQPFFDLGDFYLTDRDIEALEGLVRELHIRNPGKTQYWSDEIRSLFPDIFSELEESMTHLMDQSYNFEISRWPLNFRLQGNAEERVGRSS
jgi:hypothetical protein